jgi:hypothetical protein
MEYSTDKGKTWKPVTEGATTIEDLTAGNVLVRYPEVKDNTGKVTQPASQYVSVEAKKKADNLLKKSNSLVDKYNKGIEILNDHCVTVYNIPHFEEHLFRKDNFEMSQEEYSRMGDLLQTICKGDSDALCDLYNQQMETRGELQEAWNDHAQEREQWQRLNQCNEILKKKIKELKS